MKSWVTALRLGTREWDMDVGMNSWSEGKCEGSMDNTRKHRIGKHKGKRVALLEKRR